MGSSVVAFFLLELERDRDFLGDFPFFRSSLPGFSPSFLWPFFFFFGVSVCVERERVVSLFCVSAPPTESADSLASDYMMYVGLD